MTTVYVSVPLLLCHVVAVEERLRKGSTFKVGKDSVIGDMHGTSFLFPYPVCRKDSYYMVQLVPRGAVPTVAIVRREHIEAFGISSSEDTHYAEMRSGNSSTVLIRCKFYYPAGVTQKGSVIVEATSEVLVHVMYRNDSFPVPPINALGKHYVIMSFSSVVNPPSYYFFYIANARAPSVLSIQDSNRNATALIELKNLDVFIYWSEFSLTGTHIQSNGSLMVVSGVCEGKMTSEFCHPLMETMMPVPNWGKYYTFVVPFNGRKAQLWVATYAFVKTASIHARNQFGGVLLTLKPDGTPVDLAQLVDGEKSVVVVSGTRPFQLLFLLISEEFRNQYQVPYAPPYRVHSLIQVPPLEQYYSDPCVFGQRNVLQTEVIVAGLPFSKRPSLNSTLNKFLGPPTRVGPIWVATHEGQVTRTLARYLAKPLAATGGNSVRLWFYDLTIIKRFDTAFYLNGGHNQFVLYSICQRSNNSSQTPMVDDDCDGLVDEEIPNGQDDDCDGLTDEDNYTFVSYDCENRVKQRYTWEPFRYRLTRYESTGVQLACRLPDDNNAMVSISAGVGILMVFVFIFVIWLVDAVEMYLDPSRRITVF